LIEINLLPLEYRVQERTPLGLFLTIIAGICVVGAIGVYELDLRKKLSNAQADNERLTKERDTWKAEKEKVDALRERIKKAELRQNTIIEISQSKIAWAQKLAQFGAIMKDYPKFWIERLNLARSGTGGTLTLNFYAVGDNLRDIATFRERVIQDTNFWYHFDKFDSPRQTITAKGGGPLGKYNAYDGPVMYFDVNIPVGTGTK
jgi:Tfp pilus assembly protein PilN